MQLTTFILAAISIGSVFGAPSTIARRDTVLGTAISAVNTAETTVASEVATISTALQGPINSQTVTVIEGSLANIASAISSLTPAVATLVTDVALPLTQDELNSLPGLLSSADDIVSNVKTALNNITSSVLPPLDQVAVDGEALAVLNTISPFISPITQFANSAIAGVTGPAVSTIQSTLTSISGIVSQLLGLILGGL